MPLVVSQSGVDAVIPRAAEGYVVSDVLTGPTKID